MIASTQQNLGTDLDMSRSGAPPRNWRGIGLAMLVIAVVMSLVLLSIFLLSPDNPKLPEKSPLMLSDLEYFEDQAVLRQLSWASDSEIILETRDGNLIQQNLETKKSNVLLNNVTFLALQTSHARLSADLQNLLLASKSQKVAGVSLIASYSLYNIRSRHFWNISPPGKNETMLQYAGWGPKGSQLVFVFNNDIYYQESALGPMLRLTSLGDSESVLNGIGDWTYQEEVLHSYSTHWWSPDGARLAYLSINTSRVPNMELPHFVGADYPASTRYAYPKAGQPIPVVKVYIVNLYGPSHTVEILRPDSFDYREYYITLVSWVTNIQLAVQWLNRSQNLSVLTICDAITGICVEKHRASADMWISTQAVPVFSTDNIFLLVPAKPDGQGEYMHVAMLSTELGSKDSSLRMLTSGDWDVTRIVAYNEDNKTVYFLSTEDMPRRRHLYSVETSGILNRTCVTCDLIPDCHFVDVEFSPRGGYFILFCKGPGIPQISVHSTNNPKDFLLIEDNQVLKTYLGTKDMPETMYRTVQIDDYDLSIRMTLPSGYQDAEYPLVLWLPEAPGSQQVTEIFSLGWESVLVSSFQVIVAKIDGRGSKNQGLNMLHGTDRKLGSAEIKDHLPLVQHLKHLPFVDKKRIGVYGKAYGGFLALKLLSSSEDLFVCGAVIAPITSFQLHSAVLAERYLGMPSQEGSSYMMASVLNDVQRLQSQQFLLVHGTADANVHFQHTAELLNRLIQAGANVTSRIYPDEDHFFLSKGSQQHLHQSVISYLQSCLQNGGTRQRDL
ncbi:inactive dipeptidyl peptidase 10-like isoform X1 [Rana temporaria]|uniref:inactive dipeptidyl peptidase 10-like isoform X1 n=1 Tax=Rana temporaria TaxID=8407 RepID=UPI001AAE130F|nr:inactive dipeptidyl peptidase 10-like isoform X1 [Rana temporaria]